MATSTISNNKFQFAIDRGGTFTDVYARCPGGKTRVLKLLSVDPSNYPDAPREGIRRILQQEMGKTIPKHEPIETENIDWIRMGTTVATNALLERKGEKMALLITKGLRDLLYIGNQTRPNIFDLEIITPGMLYQEVLEVDERVIVTKDSCRLDQSHWNKVTGTTTETLLVKRPLNTDRLKEDLITLLNKGINSLAVVLMHSYTYPVHEQEIGRIATEMGFKHVSLSSNIMPMVKIIPRGFTASTDAYLTPLIKKYVEGFASGFKNSLKDVNVLFMQSDGGLTSMHTFYGSRAILSGPAGGVVGYAKTSFTGESPVIGFDMGGTSTDVSRFAGEFEHVFETTTAGVTIQAPQLDVNTVAAGGGSMLFFRSGMFVVGPESASAHPGPVCYKKGGPLTVTDANLFLGRILPEYFPHIFGPNENEPLDKAATMAAFKEMGKTVNGFLPDKQMSIEEIAMGFIHVANEAMCRPIRALTQGRGYDTKRHVLSCFGGAGGQHACAIAQNLGISNVVIHKYAGILSAFGIACADVVEDLQEPCAKSYVPERFDYLDDRIEKLEKSCREELIKQGFTSDLIELQPFLHLRYDGTDCALMCTVKAETAKPGSTSKFGDFIKVFLKRYQSEFGFTIPDRQIIVDDIRVRGVGKTDIPPDHEIPEATSAPIPEKITQVYFDEGYLDTQVYLLRKLQSGHTIDGPAIVIDDLSTILVKPNCTLKVTPHGDVVIHITYAAQKNIGTTLDSIQLSIFSHRFMSIAEQMGRVLQRTSISTNIKERLDFSCALFGPDGGLISNAPHIPVHLGAMQETVQFQMKLLADHLYHGDVILCNHPSCGGSHLPDLTIITPVFLENMDKPTFFVANRGHHADIGGITPGSMPPHSKTLSEEGACFKSFKIVDRGIFQEEKLIEALMAPAKIPGSSGTRNLKDNLSDLHAQIASNQKGINLVKELIDSYGLDVVHAYMKHIQENAEIAVRDVLREFGNKSLKKTGKSVLTAKEFMDDGTPIKLKVSINSTDGSAVMDFTGTGYEVWGNCNAPRAITLSALIYCLRCLVGQDIPLNQGCLKPVELIVPKGTILDPSEGSAVVGGNVLTSQRIVDVIFKAFEVCAASQGCMNNITFGDETVGYYETVAGGSGAGPTWHGRSGVHTHMTNTRITDPEILELRYPIILNHFGINHGTGGRGLFNGGDGLCRELLFRKSLVLSILTERRAFQPYGLHGGEPGQRGLNILVKKDGRIINVGGKACVPVDQGDVFRLLTPAGGGYGLPTTEKHKNENSHSVAARKTFIARGSVHEYKMAQESV